MSYITWANNTIKKMDVWDIGLTKLSVLAFGLFLAKVWPALLSIKWEVFLVVFILAAIRPISKAFN